MIYVRMQTWMGVEGLSKEAGQVFGPIPLKRAEKQSWSLGKWNALSLSYISRTKHACMYANVCIFLQQFAP